MFQKTYQLTSQLPAAAAMQRLKDLFRKEGVRFRSSDLSITSVKTPIAIGLRPQSYSSRNWVGVNPFTFVSGVNVSCNSGANDVAKIKVQINQSRTFIYVAFWFMCSGFVAVSRPELEYATLLIVVTTIGAWFGLMWFMGGLLIKKEILDCLNAGSV